MVLREAIAALLEDPQDRVLARAILGTVDADAIAARAVEFTARERARLEAAMTYAMAYTARCDAGAGAMSDRLAALPRG